MSKNSRPPHNWRQARRMRAWELHEQGWKQKDIATALGVSEGAVSQWLKKAKAQGVEALRHQPPPGRQPRLSPEQMAQLPTWLAQGAQAFGFGGQVWTTARVVEMIRQQFGVSSHRAHGSRLLRRIKQSRQKPIQKATQRDEAAIAACKEQRWPARKKRPSRKSGRESLSINRLFTCSRWRYAPMRPWARPPP